jgi:hypothetical protein
MAIRYVRSLIPVAPMNLLINRFGFPSSPFNRNLCIRRVKIMIKASAKGAAGEIMPCGRVSSRVTVIAANRMERIRRFLLKRKLA